MAGANLILIGLAARGRGKSARSALDQCGVPLITVGGIVRRHVARETELGKRAKDIMNRGALFSDELVIDMAISRLTEEDMQAGFILDGLPRTIVQADLLEDRFAQTGRRFTAALLTDAPDEVVLRRISGRRVCIKCGRVYHVEFDPSTTEGVCDRDGGALIHRDDDQPEAVRGQLEVYHASIHSLVAYYDAQGFLRRIDDRSD